VDIYHAATSKVTPVSHGDKSKTRVDPDDQSIHPAEHPHSSFQCRVDVVDVRLMIYQGMVLIEPFFLIGKLTSGITPICAHTLVGDAIAD
jgi:hypothetical protein